VRSPNVERDGVVLTVRVRFAPSPTGYLHIGGARTALFNWLFARHHGGKFILRIEDTDAERTVEDSVSQILESFRWLGLDWDEGPLIGGPCGPYFQSQRREIHREYADRLVQSCAVYRCYCTPEELAARRESARKEGLPPRYDGRCKYLTREEISQFEREGRRPVLRLRTPDEGVTVVSDLIHGDVAFDNLTIGDFVVLKSDGLPVYNFACVVDDHLMGISHVIRADEHLSNTPRQLMLYDALRLPAPKFAHVPMILAPDRTKLSKRHGAISVGEFQAEGYLPEALLNYLALLGWSPESGSEFMDKDEMIRQFSLERVSKTPAIYDIQKITWMNGHYLREMNLDVIVERALPYYRSVGFQGSLIELKKIVAVLRDRAKTLAELAEASSYLFSGVFSYDEKGERKHFGSSDVIRILRAGREALSGVYDFDLENTERAYREVINRLQISGGALIHPTRLALTGRTVGPGLFDVMVLLGKEETIRRLDRAIEYLESRYANAT